jgi:hypothetical protein
MRQGAMPGKHRAIDGVSGRSNAIEQGPKLGRCAAEAVKPHDARPASVGAKLDRAVSQHSLPA